METEKEREREQATFHRLQRVVAGLWVWDAKNYPSLAQPQHADAKLIFAIPHVMLHLVGAVGMIAKHVEPTGHGKPFTDEHRQAVEVALAKLIINVLMLASHLDIEAGRLPEIMRRIMNEQATKINEHRRDHGIVG